ncbi:MAG: ABC transporter ATP-binding protein [Luteolibacter sp.]
MKRFLPLYRHLLKVKWPFLLGVLAGFVYAVSSGAGLPMMLNTVIPILFEAEAEVTDSNAFTRFVQGLLGEVPREQLIFFTCLLIPLVMLLRSGAAFANAYLIQLSGHRVLEELRADMFSKLQSLPLAFYKKNRAGDLLSRLMGDTQQLRMVLVNCSSDLIKQPATLVAALGVLVYMSIASHSFFITLISMLSVPLCVACIRYASKRLGERAKALQGQTGDLSATLTESLQSPLEIRAYNLEERQMRAFREKVHEIFRLSLKITKYRQFISPSVEFVAALGFALALYAGVKSGMTYREFAVLGMALFMSYEPIKKLGMVVSMLRQGEASLERMEYVLNEPDHLPDPQKPEPAEPPKRSIRLENLSFAYEKEAVLSEVNVDIPVGQVVALIGPSGAGKSTFASLLPRFYDPQEGSISWDGTDLRQFRKADLRRRIAVVPQMPALFAGTVSDNIQLGRLDATQSEIEAAAKRAHADAFIRAMPDGYDTLVGERGDKLSGGQRQRIAIARAFLRDAPILILDEATSALDAESEAGVQQALADLVKGRTTFIIAHRFSTISIAQRILAFDNGRIVADGTHEQLRETSPIYQAMASGHIM